MNLETKVQRILNLLKESTSLGVVSAFLKSKSLPSSAGNWEKMFSERIFPAVKENKLSILELTQLVADVEEAGQQHIFLYNIAKSSSAESLIDKNRVKKIMVDMKIDDLLKEPKILHMPASPTITEVRWDHDSKGKPISLVIKIVEKRTYTRFAGEDFDGTYTIKKYQHIEERGISVFKLHSDGLLELRIKQKSNTTKYTKDIESLWRMVQLILPIDKFNTTSLSKAKLRLWNDKDKLQSIIRYTSSTFKNDRGVTQKLSMGTPNKDLMKDSGAIGGIKGFVDRDGYCDGSNFWLIPTDAGVPEKELHIILGGLGNEFAVTMSCQKADYEYALKQIRSLNI